MSETSPRVSAMAFKTRSGRTAAIGRGAMITSMWIWNLPMVLLPAIVANAAFFVLWSGAPPLRTSIERLLPGWFALTIEMLGLVLMIRVFAALCVATCFIGPFDRVRDSVFAVLRSRTGCAAVLSELITVALMPIIRFPFGPARFPLIAALTVALAIVDSLVLIGLRRISRASRKNAYFDNMTDGEKEKADRPWPKGEHPSFADPDALLSATDARLYASRATTIARAHTWAGAGITLVFSAFIGTAVTASWVDQGPGSMFLMVLVFGAIAIGYGLQRRANSYRRLAKAFHERAASLSDTRPRRSLTARGRAVRRARRALLT